MNPAITLIYATFALSVGLYVRGAIKYKNIESWPSVEAEVIGGGGRVISAPTQNRFGSSFVNIDARFIEFRYSVEGTTYRSTTATPNGGGVPLSPLGGSWRAYYNRSSPHIAVLSPVPFDGTGLIALSGFSGVLIFGHIFHLIHMFVTRNRIAEQAEAPKP